MTARVNPDASLYIAARPVTTRSLGMGEPPSAAGLQAPSGGVLLVAPRSLRAVAGAVDLASVATAADHSLGATVRAKKQSSRRRVTVFGTANAKWTDATIARIMPLHACPARCGHGVEAKQPSWALLPCLPSITSKLLSRHPHRVSRASPKGPGRRLTLRTHRQKLAQATLASIPIHRTLSLPESRLAPSNRAFSPPTTIGLDRLLQRLRAAFPLAKPKRIAEIVLRPGPWERDPVARPFLQRPAIRRYRPL